MAGTAVPAVYRTERHGMKAYVFPVANGVYEVKRHFAETDDGISAPGQRTFTVSVEGSALPVDVFAEAKARHAAVVKAPRATVADGTLDITCIRGANNPVVQAIEIIPARG